MALRVEHNPIHINFWWLKTKLRNPGDVSLITRFYCRPNSFFFSSCLLRQPAYGLEEPSFLFCFLLCFCSGKEEGSRVWCKGKNRYPYDWSLKDNNVLWYLMFILTWDLLEPGWHKAVLKMQFYCRKRKKKRLKECISLGSSVSVQFCSPLVFRFVIFLLGDLEVRFIQIAPSQCLFFILSWLILKSIRDVKTEKRAKQLYVYERIEIMLVFVFWGYFN